MSRQISDHPLLKEVDGTRFSSASLFIKSQDTSLSSVASQNEKISTSVENAANSIVNAIQSPPKAPFVSATLLSALLSAVVAASAAFCYNKLHWYSVIKRESRLKVIESIVDIIGELREDAVAYWLKGYSRKGAKILLEEEMRVKEHLNLINSLITNYLTLISKKNQKQFESKLRDFHGELYDLITGDDFESSSRKQDKAKASLISTKCVSFKVFLNTIKL